MFSSLILLSLSACGNGTSPITEGAQREIEVPSDIFFPPTDDSSARQQVISGWLQQYSDFAEDTVAAKYPNMLNLSGDRMSTVCPKWSSLTRGEREKFWSSLLWAIALPESGRKRTAVYRETTMSTDAVTGLQIRSEGLLQLSYVDLKNHRYPFGDISWAYDRTMALSDYAKGVSSGNPTRTLLNAYSNLNLGLFIINRMVGKYPTEKLEKTMGKYWSTMRSTNPTFQVVMKQLKIKSANCF